MPNADGRSDSPSPETRDIPRWTAAYARNRVLTRAYTFGLFVIFMTGTVLFGKLGGLFRQQGETALAWISVGLFGLSYAGLGLAVLLSKAAQLDQFEGELAATPSSLWGEIHAAIRAEGTKLTVVHASLWLVVVPLFLWLARMERSAGNEAWALIWFAAGLGGILTLIAAWARRRGYRLLADDHLLGNWLFPEEGGVAPAPPLKSGWWDYAVGIGFAVAIQAMVVLGMMGHLPIEYQQPISALAVVPMLIYGGLRGKRHTGILCWVFAALYGMHAILVVAGAPIQFGGKWLPLNMLVPVCGYGLLSFLAAYAYSRRALRKLRALARVPVESSVAEERD